MSEVFASVENERIRLLLKVKELKLELKRVQEREAKIKSEMEDVDAQIAYYDHLTKDIKKDIHPPKLYSLLQDMKKA